MHSLTESREAQWLLIKKLFMVSLQAHEFLMEQKKAQYKTQLLLKSFSSSAFEILLSV